MPTLTIHAGAPKAGSSSIQKMLEHASSFVSNEIYIPPIEGGLRNLMGGGGTAHSAFSEVTAKGRAVGFGSLLRIADGRDVVLSSEFAFFCDEHDWHLIAKVAAYFNYEIRIFLLIREPLDSVISGYSQSVSRSFKTLTLAENLRVANDTNSDKASRALVWSNVARQHGVDFLSFSTTKHVLGEWVSKVLLKGTVSESSLAGVAVNRSLRAWEIDICRLWNSTALHSQSAQLETFTLGEALKLFEPLGSKLTVTKHHWELAWERFHRRYLEWFQTVETHSGWSLEFGSPQMLEGVHDLSLGLDSPEGIAEELRISLPDGAEKILIGALTLVSNWNNGAARTDLLARLV